jgi:hypothetical protein
MTPMLATVRQHLHEFIDRRFRFNNMTSFPVLESFEHLSHLALPNASHVNRLYDKTPAEIHLAQASGVPMSRSMLY